MALQRKTPLTAKTPMNRGTSQLKRSELKRSGRLASRGEGPQRKPMKQSSPSPAVAPAVLAGLKGRAGIWCELQRPGVCVGFGQDPAHRIGQGVGGLDVLSNLHFACRMCHDWSHEHRAESEALGWILRSRTETTVAPTLYRGRWARLDDAGNITYLDTPGDRPKPNTSG